jgi:catechol 2,3-dioxygenase-like lactoylglutathione lyase family enzyme
MKLNHVNLSVQDVPAARSFFEQYMKFESADSKPNDSLAVLNGTDGFVLVLMNESMNKQGNTSYPDAFHVGFFLGNEAEVITLYDELQKGGITVGEAPQRIRKTFGFYFYLQNVLIEIAA